MQAAAVLHPAIQRLEEAIKKQKMYPMKKFAKKHFLTILGVAIGAGAGYLYWNFVGCSTGSCAITSSPVNSTLYGGLMGGVLFSIFQTKQKTI